MKRTAFVTLGLMAVMGAYAQAPGFKHLKQIDLSSQFASANPLGVGADAVDVAFDGTDAYVIGYGIGTGPNGTGPATQGVLKITDVLNTATAGSGAFFSTTAPEGGWDSKILFHQGSLYAGFGLGSTFGGAIFSGVHKLDLAGGLDTTFGGGDGIMTPNEATGTTNGTSQIFNFFDIDPRNPQYTSIGHPFTSLLRARGFAWQAQLNGVYGGRNYFSDVANLGDGPFPANWVSIFRASTYDAAGNMYLHNGQAIMRLARRADTGGGFNEATSAFNNITTLRVLGGTTQAINQSLALVPASSGVYESFLAFNDRSTAPGPFSVQVVKADGTDFSPAISLTGAESLPGGAAGSAFTSDRLITRTFTAGGKRYLFVVQAGTNDQLNVYEVGLATTDTTVSGTLDQNGWGGGARDFTVTVITSGGTEVKTVSVNGDGTYSFTTTLSGSGTVKFARRSYNAKQVAATLGTNPVNATLVAGDVDDDDTVSILDYIFLSSNYEKDSSASDWNTPDPGANNAAPADADFDGDGSISILDYITLSTNFEASGDGKP